MTNHKKVKLICIPYAGGMSYTYLVWKKYLPEDIELIPIELPGRGRRYNEQLIVDMNDMVHDIFKQIKDIINENEYVLFGHSMGSTITYELIKIIRKNQCREPLHIFYSGRLAPHLNNYYKKISDHPDDSFFEAVYKMGGTPKEVYDIKELRSMYLPVLKADFCLLENYCSGNEIEPSASNISIFYGEQDNNTKTLTIKEWRDYSKGVCDFYEFSGEHFFIKDQAESVVKKIVDIIKNQGF